MAVPSLLLSALLLGTGCAWLAAGLPLPSFLEKCPRDNRAELNECATRQANIFIPHMINGIKKYGMMPLDPLYVPEFSLKQSALSLISTNVYMHGYSNANITSVDLDLEGKRLTFVYNVRKVTLNSTYTIDGKILILPLKGEGKSSMVHDNVVGKYEADIDTVKMKDGEDHFTVKYHRFNYSSERVHFYFSNLFNGDRTLGNATNDFLNENWEILHKEMQPAIAEVADLLFTRIIQGLLSAVPIKDMFAEGPLPVV